MKEWGGVGTVWAEKSTFRNLVCQVANLFHLCWKLF